MILNYQFEILKNIPKLTPTRTTFDMGVNASFIKNIKIEIPEGHKGLAYMRCYIAGTPLIPAQGSNVIYIRGDKQIIQASINKSVMGVPYLLFCEGYNLDNFLSHSFYIEVEV